MSGGLYIYFVGFAMPMLVWYNRNTDPSYAKDVYFHPDKSGRSCSLHEIFLTKNHEILKSLLVSYATVLIEFDDDKCDACYVSLEWYNEE